MFKPILRRLKYGLQGRSVYWSRSEIRNWGDDVNPWLYSRITGNEAVYCPHQNVSRLFMVGSILDQAGSHDICWGTGIISNAHAQNSLRLKKAYATRGPLTAQILDKFGVPVNHVYGDPGIIAARLTMSEIGSVKKLNSIGIVPHYVDLEIVQSLIPHMNINVKIIPVSLPRKSFVAEVLKCTYILSSSLHGLIVAESLGIPSAWLCISDNVIGGSFKFEDYVLGTDRKISDLFKHDRQFLLGLKSPSQINALPLYNSKEIANRLLDAFPRNKALRSV